MVVNGYTIKPFANLYGADLSRANLYGADLSGADLIGADLSRADLSGADLSRADLSRANLYGANLYGANLRGADLSGADLIGADLSGADLSRADLSRADLSRATNIPSLPHTIIVPEGDLIVYKKTSHGVAKLLIPKEAKRSNGTGRKCRAEFAKVLECFEGARSLHDSNFVYVQGEYVYPDSFDTNRWNECAPGIHFFLTREEAEAY